MRNVNDFVIAVGGKAGQGVLSCGDFIQKICQARGAYAFVWEDYPSLIKGGHNVVFVRISKYPIMAPKEGIDVLVALDHDSVEIHRSEIAIDGVIIYDLNLIKSGLFEKPTKHQVFYSIGVPLESISKGINKNTRYVNTAAIGALHGTLSWKLDTFKAIIAQKFKKKSQKIVDDNIRAMDQAYMFVEHEYDRLSHLPVLRAQPKEYVLLNGSQALAYGAIRAGVKFTAAYPMTPATPIFDTIAEVADDYAIIAKQAEDEISAICMTIGASYAGVRAFTMTSGGGFSLMVEALGLSGISETPLVVVNAMRGGPSTGLPTKTEQSDLRFALHASQGEFPRVILAPGDVEEAYYMIQEAFNLAEVYQLPVILLTDKYLATTQMMFRDLSNLDRINPDRGIVVTSKAELGKSEYKRFQFTRDGISPRALPGTKGIVFHVGSDEHNEKGEICEDIDNRVAMMDKRMKKEHSLLPELGLPRLYGHKLADITLISWGSTKHACLEAMKILEKESILVNVLHFRYLYPLDPKKIIPLLEPIRHSIVVENNATGQFAGMLREYLRFSAEDALLKYDGQPFYPEEIARAIRTYVL